MQLRTFEFPLDKPRTSDEMRILAWNVWYGNKPSHSADIVAVLRSLDCDVLLLSELIDPEFPKKIHALGYGGVFAETNYTHNFRHIGGGVGFFSRLPIQNYRVVNTREYPTGSRRCYLEATLQLGGDSLKIGTTHHMLPWEPGYKKATESLRHEITKHRKRFLLAGDLNALPSSGLIRELGQRLSHLGPKLSEKSYQSTGLARFAFPGWWRRLDYAFATPDLAAQVIETRLLPREPSDHLAIMIHLKSTAS